MEGESVYKYYFPRSEMLIKLEYVTAHTEVADDKFWGGISKPEKLVWDNVPLAVRTEIRKGVESDMKGDVTEVPLDLLEWRYRPILRAKSIRRPACGDATPSASRAACGSRATFFGRCIGSRSPTLFAILGPCRGSKSGE
ncbi:uncharacterized protein LTHEOB_13006 [Lasiodiplodia theobromae]|uniref:uncharacterized protein n=1 Tax=Lasiodiplodia theobromae TaxID=45133 RepID=UPI0015C325E2|nr:uncharacterized protein LTHEOB_13006 [Lasiodiplodia theobromae]KAF4534182.1 hypothetical protein LTHEOB_13006 [Lasiodiplodia theobromae]